MAEDEVKQNITIDGDEALAKLRELADAEQQVADKTKGAGEAADQAGPKMRGVTGTVDGLTTGVHSMIAAWSAFLGSVSFVVQGFRDIENAAQKSLDAVVDAGRSIRGLAGNIGPEGASAVFKDVTAVSAESGFDVAGRAQLLDAVSSATDIRSGLSFQQIQTLTRQLAVLQRGTGVGGRQAFQTVQSLTANLGLSDEQAVDAAATLLSSGFDAQAINEFAERGATGGVDSLALALAARQQGLDPNRAGRALPTLIAALTRTDDQGRLAPELQQLGLTDNQTFIERLASVTRQRDEGKITQGQFFRAVGGEQNARIALPLARTLATPGALDAARSELLDPNAAEDLVEAVTSNPLVATEERMNVQKLFVQAKRELGDGALASEVQAALNAATEDSFFVKRGLAKAIGTSRRYLSPTSIDDVEQIRDMTAERIRGFTGASDPQPVVNNITVIGYQVNTADPTTDIRPPEEW